MKIFHVITLAAPGGAQSVVINLANKAVEDGHSVYVLAGEKGEMWSILDSRVIQVKIASLQRAISTKKELDVLRQLRKYYKLYRPDVIQLNSSKIGVLGRIAFPKRKTIYTVHGFDSIRVAFRKFLPIEKALKNKCRFIASVSEYDTKNLKQEGIFENVVTIYNGIKDWPNSGLSFAVNNAAQNILNQLKQQDCFIVMSIARMASPKRFDLFCKVAQQFVENDKVKFIWIGNKEQPENLPENVLCLGELADAHQYLKYANLFTLLSNYEGLPMSIIEALAYNKPVIASNVGGISEILDGENGFALENNATIIMNKIEGFLTNRFDYSNFATNARQTFEKRFTVEKMYDGYLALYRKICKESIEN